MSGLVPFTGMSAGTSSTGSNPLANQLRRVGAFRQAMTNRQNQINDYKDVAEHAHGLQKDLVTHASREERRNQTHAAKVKAGLVEGLRTSGVDAAAPGRTRIKYDGLEVETVRPAPKQSGPKTSSGSKSATPAPNHSPLTPKFQSP